MGFALTTQDMYLLAGGDTEMPVLSTAMPGIPTTTPFTGLVRAPESIGDMPPRHIPRPTSLRALHCVPSGVVVRAWPPEPCPSATGGSGFTIETGTESAIGIKNPIFQCTTAATYPNARTKWQTWRIDATCAGVLQII